jgi:hypothetical protein
MPLFACSWYYQYASLVACLCLFDLHCPRLSMKLSTKVINIFQNAKLCEANHNTLLSSTPCGVSHKILLAGAL